MREECIKFGPVKQVVLPRKKRTSWDYNDDNNSDFDVSSLSGSNALVTIDESDPARQFQEQIAKLQQANAKIRAKERDCPLAKVYIEFFEYSDCLQALHQLSGRRFVMIILV